MRRNLTLCVFKRNFTLFTNLSSVVDAFFYFVLNAAVDYS